MTVERIIAILTFLPKIICDNSVSVTRSTNQGTMTVAYYNPRLAYLVLYQ